MPEKFVSAMARFLLSGDMLISIAYVADRNLLNSPSPLLSNVCIIVLYIVPVVATAT